MNHKSIIEKFYTAFQNKNYKTMISCYGQDIEFNDPMFSTLSGFKAKAIWQMLCEKGKDLTLTYSITSENENSFTVKWLAVYTFEKSGRTIHNRVTSDITLENGKIIRHHDSFSLYKWLGMAFGTTGWILGWLPFFRNRVKVEALKGLDLFIRRKKISEGSY